MKLIETNISERSAELVFADSESFEEAQQLIVLRMPAELDETDSLALHRLATLRAAREIIGAEIQRLSSLVDQTR